MNLEQALARLDGENENHWTADGLPRMDAVHLMTGDSTIKRMDITNIAPALTREYALERAAQAVDEEEADARAAEVSQPDLSSGGGIASALPPEPVEAILPGVPAGQSVMDMDARAVLASPVLTDALLGELDQKIIEAHRRKTKIEEELEQLNLKNEIVKRHQARQSRGQRPKDESNAIQSYLKTMAAIRAEKAERAQRFLAAGTTPEEVALAMSAKSPVDRAMNARKPPIGSQRPSFPAAV